MEKITLSEYGYDCLQIETASACNMACSFCPYPLKDDKTTKLPLQDIKNIIDQVNPNDKKLRHIAFSLFNEPLLDDRVFEVAEYAKKSGFKISITTNGVLLNKEKNVEGILKLKPSIVISLQVLDVNVHKSARGLNLELDRYVKPIIDFCIKAKNKDFNVQVDIGCNYNSKLSFYLKKILGTSAGDPSVPRDVATTISRLREILKMFHDISDNEYKKNSKALLDIKEIKKIFDKEYSVQDGWYLYKNVKIKMRCFWYGRKQSQYKPIGNNFSCNTTNLGILADGHIVPCCLAYNQDLSLGKVSDSSLKSILDNNKFLYNLRKKGGEKHINCRKCFGEPTSRGVFIKNLYFMLPSKIRHSKLLKFFTRSY